MNKAFRGLIEDIKERYGINQGEIAERLGVTRQYISSVIGGTAPFNDTLKAKIMAAFPDAELREYGNDNMQTVVEGKPESDENTVPLLPIFAQAGHLTGWSDAVTEVECERVISPIKDIDMAVHVYGESMYPDIPNGSVVYVRKVKSILEWGRPYILDTVDGPLLKYLTPGRDDKHFRCISANHDPKYAPFEVMRADVLGIYRVVMCMSMK